MFGWSLRNARRLNELELQIEALDARHAELANRIARWQARDNSRVGRDTAAAATPLGTDPASARILNRRQSLMDATRPKNGQGDED